MRIRNLYLVSFLLSGLLVLGCTGGCSGSGGGGAAKQVLTQRTLSWNPPTQYTDGTNIDNLAADLKEYRIFVRQDNNFSPSDAYDNVAVVDGANLPVTQYDLRNAAPKLGLVAGVWYYVSMKTVSMAGVESDFSPPSGPFKF